MTIRIVPLAITAILLGVLPCVGWAEDASDDFHAAGCPVGCARCDAAADRAFDHLLAVQAADGSWPSHAADHPRAAWIENATPSLTAIACLALLADGAVPGEGGRGEALDRGLRWLLTWEETELTGGFANFHEGFLLMALAAGTPHLPEEGVGDRVAASVRRIAGRQGGDALLRAAQAHQSHMYAVADGGWAYRDVPDREDHPVFGSERDAEHVIYPEAVGYHLPSAAVTAHVLAGLLACRRAGHAVPDGTVDAAREYLGLCLNADGGLRYRPMRSETTTVIPDEEISVPGTTAIALHAAGLGGTTFVPEPETDIDDWWGGGEEDWTVSAAAFLHGHRTEPLFEEAYWERVRDARYEDWRTEGKIALVRDRHVNLYRNMRGFWLFHSALAARIGGEDAWSDWWRTARDEWIDRPGEDGLWRDVSVLTPMGPEGKRTYATALAALTIRLPAGNLAPWEAARREGGE